MVRTALGQVPALESCRRQIASAGITIRFAKIAVWLQHISGNWQKQTFRASMNRDGFITLSDPAALAFLSATKPVVLAHRTFARADKIETAVKIVVARKVGSSLPPIMIVSKGSSPIGGFLFDAGAQLAYYYHAERAVRENEQIYVMVLDETRKAEIHGMAFYKARQNFADTWLVRFSNKKFSSITNMGLRTPLAIRRVLGENRRTVIARLLGENALAPFDFGITGYIADPFPLYPTHYDAAGQPTTFGFPTQRPNNSVLKEDLAKLGIEAKDGVCARLVDGRVVEIFSPRDISFGKPIYYRLARRPVSTEEGLAFPLSATTRMRFDSIGSYGGFWVAEGLGTHPVKVSEGTVDARASFGNDFPVYSCSPVEVGKTAWPTHASLVVRDKTRLLFAAGEARLSSFSWQIVRAAVAANMRFPQNGRTIKELASQAYEFYKADMPEIGGRILKILQAYSKGEFVEIGVGFSEEAGAVFVEQEEILEMLGARQPILLYKNEIKKKLVGKEIVCQIIPSSPLSGIFLVDKESGRLLYVFYFEEQNDCALLFHPGNIERARYLVSFRESDSRVVEGLTFVRQPGLSGEVAIAKFEGGEYEMVLGKAYNPAKAEPIYDEGEAGERTLIGYRLGSSPRPKKAKTAPKSRKRPVVAKPRVPKKPQASKPRPVRREISEERRFLMRLRIVVKRIVQQNENKGRAARVLAKQARGFYAIELQAISENILAILEFYTEGRVVQVEATNRARNVLFINKFGADGPVAISSPGLDQKLAGRKIACEIIDVPSKPAAGIFVTDQTSGEILYAFFYEKASGRAFTFKTLERMLYSVPFFESEIAEAGDVTFRRGSRKVSDVVVAEFMDGAFARVLNRSLNATLHSMEVQQDRGGHALRVIVGTPPRRKRRARPKPRVPRRPERTVPSPTKRVFEPVRNPLPREDRIRSRLDRLRGHRNSALAGLGQELLDRMDDGGKDEAMDLAEQVFSLLGQGRVAEAVMLSTPY